MDESPASTGTTNLLKGFAERHASTLALMPRMLDYVLYALIVAAGSETSNKNRGALEAISVSLNNLKDNSVEELFRIQASLLLVALDLGVTAASFEHVCSNGWNTVQWPQETQG